MSKRKVGVSDIIYELDNEDIEISSDDECKDAKKICLETQTTANATLNKLVSDEDCIEVINISCPNNGICDLVSPTKECNGGKTSPHIVLIDDTQNEINELEYHSESVAEVDCNKKNNIDSSNTTIFNEDIVVDSPASNIDLGVVGCENKTPLVTVKFRDKRLAKNYKTKLKAFMIKLIKLHDDDFSADIDSETDLELDVWPEDLLEEDLRNKEDVHERKEAQDNLFFIDTTPCVDESNEIPRYSQVSTLISNIPEVEPSVPIRRGPTCFNCDGAHQLRDCPLPRDNVRISENRRNLATVRVGRYHVEDEQKYGHLIPGRISGQLRHALGLKRQELPLHIYRMRLLGYPPGWLEEARISHSGITMFDSSGNAIQDPEEEEGEVCEPGSKDKFDIKKILDFPGFNVPASSRYKEEGNLYGLPPMSEHDSKMAMLQMLAPNAVKAYKRKKLTFYPTASQNNSLQGQAEMELDSGDETAVFPSVPPLPDEAPPPLPPPPNTPPPPPMPEKSTETTLEQSSQDSKTECSTEETDDIEVIEVTQVKDIPIPSVEINTENNEQMQSGDIDSVSLDDLEEKKRLLLDALKKDVTSPNSTDVVTDTESEIQKIDIITEDENTHEMTDEKVTVNESEGDVDISIQSIASVNILQSSDVKDKDIDSDSDVLKTPDTKAKGMVKTSSFGTPVLNAASTYLKLPSDNKFSKDICDVINFENLPNSTGKFKQISDLLRKVKSEVDRIQES